MRCGIRRRIGGRSIKVGMSDHRGSSGTRRPVLAGAILGSGERGAVRLRARAILDYLDRVCLLACSDAGHRHFSYIARAVQREIWERVFNWRHAL